MMIICQAKPLKKKKLIIQNFIQFWVLKKMQPAMKLKNHFVKKQCKENIGILIFQFFKKLTTLNDTDTPIKEETLINLNN